VACVCPLSTITRDHGPFFALLLPLMPCLGTSATMPPRLSPQIVARLSPHACPIASAPAAAARLARLSPHGHQCCQQPLTPTLPPAEWNACRQQSGAGPWWHRYRQQQLVVVMLCLVLVVVAGGPCPPAAAHLSQATCSTSSSWTYSSSATGYSATTPPMPSSPKSASSAPPNAPPSPRRGA
jgi:hypothetical protein